MFSWYWGHEHLCSLYDRHPEWGLLGRCIGHSGFPYARPEVADAPVVATVPDAKWHQLPPRKGVPGALVLDGPNQEIPGKAEKFGPNGYAVLEFEGEHLVEAIMSPRGELLHRAQLA